MIWTKDKPTVPGYYWLKMNYETPGQPFSNQPPRVVAVFFRNYEDENKDELFALEGPNYEDGNPVAKMSDNFDWSSEQITLPSVKGSCSCHLYGNAACSSCDDTMPQPLVAP